MQFHRKPHPTKSNRKLGNGVGVQGLGIVLRSQRGPLLSEFGTHKKVKARFCPWLSGGSPETHLSCSFPDQQPLREIPNHLTCRPNGLEQCAEKLAAGIMLQDLYRVTSLIRNCPPSIGPP